MTEIPTFPPHKKSPPPLVVVVFASIFGGILGTLVLFTLFPEYRLAEIPPGINSVVVDRPGKVIIEEETRVDDLRNQASYYVGEVFTAKTVSTEPQNYPWFANQIQAYVTVLTSDGYFVSAENGVAIGDYVRIKDQAYEVTEIAPDPASNLLFGRIEAFGLPTPSLASHKDLRLGMSAIGVLADRAIQRTTISNLAHNQNITRNYYLNSDSIDLVYALETDTIIPGLPYFDMSGNLIGINVTATESPKLVPAYVIQTGLNSYITNAEIIRNEANLDYIAIPSKPGIKIYRRLSEGDSDEILLDDIILRLNGQDITSDPHSFAQIFHTLTPETEVQVTVLRDEETLELTLPIGEL